MDNLPEVFDPKPKPEPKPQRQVMYSICVTEDNICCGGIAGPYTHLVDALEVDPSLSNQGLTTVIVKHNADYTDTTLYDWDAITEVWRLRK